jgi:hypothetical protein
MKEKKDMIESVEASIAELHIKLKASDDKADEDQKSFQLELQTMQGQM